MTTAAGRPPAVSVVPVKPVVSPGDRLLAVGLCLLYEVPHFLGLPGLGVDGRSSFTIGLAVLGAVLTLSTAWRKRYPLAVLLITMTTGTLLLVLGDDVGPVGFPHEIITGATLLVWPAMLVAIYTVARCGVPRGRPTLGGSVLALAIVVTWASNQSYSGTGVPWPGDLWDMLRNGLVAVLVLATVWMLGDVVRARGETAQVRLAARHAEAAEHDRAVAAEERARIARELHDITAHHISVVTLQAGTARLLAEAGRQPDAETLAAIETAARQAMIEIRQALGVIRSTPGGAAPLPGLAQLPELANRMGLAGLAVTVTGDCGPLPGGLDLTAYRIVQEGLANVARHSAASAAEVILDRDATALGIVITDAGPARAQLAAGAGGHGLVGIRERVLQYGGAVRAGPLPDGGFRLHATLPVPDAA